MQNAIAQNVKFGSASEYDISCVKRGYLRLLTPHTSSPRSFLPCPRYCANSPMRRLAYLCTEVAGYRHLILLILQCKKPKMLPFYGEKRWKIWNFSGGYLFTHYEFILVCGYFEWKWRIFNNYSTRACWITNDRLPTRRIAPSWL